jgi:hypothetical protein
LARNGKTYGFTRAYKYGREDFLLTQPANFPTFQPLFFRLGAAVAVAGREAAYGEGNRLQRLFYLGGKTDAAGKQGAFELTELRGGVHEHGGIEVERAVEVAHQPLQLRVVPLNLALLGLGQISNVTKGIVAGNPAGENQFHQREGWAEQM